MRVPLDAEDDLRALLTLFTFEKKSALEQYSRTFVLRPFAFSNLVLACDQGLLPFKRGAHYKYAAPQDLPPVFAPAPPASTCSPGLDVGKIRRVLRRLRYETRWSAGHLFYTSGLHEWHFFVLDHHDQERDSRNHWKGGTHMHFVNWLWPRLDPRRVWNDFVTSGKRPGSALHLRDESEAA
jgi:hypothetical protein